MTAVLCSSLVPIKINLLSSCPRSTAKKNASPGRTSNSALLTGRNSFVHGAPYYKKYGWKHSVAKAEKQRKLNILSMESQEESPLDSSEVDDDDGKTVAIEYSGNSSSPETEDEGKKKRKYQSSWDAKNPDGQDYLYTLGKESDNLNITVGAREGMIDNLFIGDFLGKDSDIVFKYRQKVTRSFEHLQGDYYIAPAYMEKVVTFLAKNFLYQQLNVPIPLILGIWGGKGQGKTFQTELIFKALGVEPVILSAGEMESEWAGEPGKLIRTRYREASQVIKNKGKLSCLMINDLDAGIGRFENTQMTVNNQMVVGTLMNLCDNPTRVSIGQDWRMADTVNRVPIVVTGNDFSTMWAPLIRDGRMEKFYWQPTREDVIGIVYQMYIKDGLSVEDIAHIIDTFPTQALDFYGALRSRTYDKHILQWIKDIGGAEKMGALLVKRGRSPEDPLPTITPPVQTVESLINAGRSLVEEQKMVMSMKLSDEYMKKQTGGGGLISMS